MEKCIEIIRLKWVVPEYYATVAQISDKSDVSLEKVQDCLEGDLSQFIIEKNYSESEFRFEERYMNILPIISLFDSK